MWNWKKIARSPIAQVGAVALIIVTGAGAAAGQEVLGEGSVAVEEALTVTAVKVEGGNGGMTVVNEEGAYFAASVSVYSGDSYRLHVRLENAAEDRLLALLVADAPAGFSLEATLPETPTSVTSIVNIEENRWILEVQPATGDDQVLASDMVITIAVSPSVSPGRYNVSYEITPFDPTA